MIYYERKLWSNITVPPISLQLRTFQYPLCFALVSAILSTILWHVADQSPDIKGLLAIQSSTYGSFTTLLGLLLVFRTSQATGRFWESVTLLHAMLGDWFDASSTLLSFLRFSNADEDVINEKKQVLVRLMSMLNALVLGDLEARGGQEPIPHKFQLLDVHSIDRQSLDSLKTATNKSELVFQWIQNLIVDMIRSEVLCVPAPLMTRIFQDLGNGLNKFHESMKFAEVPVPFPYVAATEITLYTHTIITPIVSVQWSPVVYQCPFFTFVIVFVLWSLFTVAGELENPFGNVDVNDLDTDLLQSEMNRQLLCLLHPPSSTVPYRQNSVDEASRRLAAFRDQFSFSMDTTRLDRKTQADAETEETVTTEETVNQGQSELSLGDTETELPFDTSGENLVDHDFEFCVCLSLDEHHRQRQLHRGSIAQERLRLGISVTTMSIGVCRADSPLLDGSSVGTPSVLDATCSSRRLEHRPPNEEV